jgi:hypothetical protein
MYANTLIKPSGFEAAHKTAGKYQFNEPSRFDNPAKKDMWASRMMGVDIAA